MYCFLSLQQDFIYYVLVRLLYMNGPDNLRNDHKKDLTHWITNLYLVKSFRISV